MKIVFTLNLQSNLKAPTEPGSGLQQIYGEHPCTTMEELVRELHTKDYILVREFFVRTKFDKTKWNEDRGYIILNVQLIGKVKEFFEQSAP